MGPTARTLGGVSILGAPLLLGVADQLRMAAEPPADLGGIDGDYDAAAAAANLASIQEHHGLFATASWLVWVATLLTAVAAVAIWRLSVAGSPRWAWVGAVAAGIGVLGLMGQFVAYYGISQVLAAQPDAAAAGALDIAMSGHPFALGIFVPVLAGTVGALAQAVGMARARVIPLWAAGALVVGPLLHVVLGSTPVVSAVWTVLLLAGSVPAVLALRRVRPTAPVGEPAPAA